MGVSSLFLLLAIALGTGSAGAKEKRAKASGASSLRREDFVRCAEESLRGRRTEDCAGREDAKECVGLEKALRYASTRSVCMRVDSSADGCAWWGHRERTQPEWLSIASGHLTHFGACLDAYYDTAGAATLEKARADTGLVSLLGKFPDGASHLGLAEGAILRRTLDGDTLGMIYMDTPWRQRFETREAYTMKDAADTPIPLPLRFRPENETAELPAGEESFRGLAQNFLDEEEAGAVSASLAPLAASAASSAPARAPAATAPGKDPAKVPVASPALTRRPRKAYSLNLDRTLFEMVNDVYVRHAAALRGTDDFIRRQDIGPAKDLRALLDAGGSL